MKRYSVDTSHGDCAVGFMAEDPDGDYVEFELWMAMVTAEELAELRLNAARYKQVREYYWFQREVAHRFCVTEPNSVNDLDAALDRARGVK